MPSISFYFIIFYVKSASRIRILQECTHSWNRDYFYIQSLIFLEGNSQQYGKIHSVLWYWKEWFQWKQLMFKMTNEKAFPPPGHVFLYLVRPWEISISHYMVIVPSCHLHILLEPRKCFASLIVDLWLQSISTKNCTLWSVPLEHHSRSYLPVFTPWCSAFP